MSATTQPVTAVKHKLRQMTENSATIKPIKSVTLSESSIYNLLAKHGLTETELSTLTLAQLSAIVESVVVAERNRSLSICHALHGVIENSSKGAAQRSGLSVVNTVADALSNSSMFEFKI